MSSQTARGPASRITNQTTVNRIQRVSTMTILLGKHHQPCRMDTLIQYMKKRKTKPLHKISQAGLKLGQLSRKETASTPPQQIEATKEGASQVKDEIRRVDHKMIEVRKNRMSAEILRMPGLQHHRKRWWSVERLLKKSRTRAGAVHRPWVMSQAWIYAQAHWQRLLMSSRQTPS